MTPRAYYNEIDPYAAAWLRNLIAAGHIAPGDVDERSIVDVRADDLAGYDQAHFFAGIGGWSYALRLAGWPEDRPVWTGSCPCQPWSNAGKRGGANDPRHLWPEWFRLIRECRPAAVFGEQVASKAGLGWFDLVSADLEETGYAVGAADLCAAGVGAPHIRQRLWFVAHDDRQGRDRLASARVHERRHREVGGAAEEGRADGSRGDDADGRGEDGRVADPSHGDRRRGECGAEAGVGTDGERRRGPASCGAACSLVHPAVPRREGLRPGRTARPGDEGAAAERTRAVDFWSPCDWLPCRDGKARPVEPGTFPLAHGVPARVGRLRAYGNAIVPQVAAEFVMAAMEILP